MAKYNNAISVTFNDNDGGVSWRCHPDSAYDIARHIRIFGKYRTRWILLKRFWRAMLWMENYALENHPSKFKAWKLNAEIPE